MADMAAETVNLFLERLDRMCEALEQIAENTAPEAEDDDGEPA